MGWKVFVRSGGRNAKAFIPRRRIDKISLQKSDQKIHPKRSTKENGNSLSPADPNRWRGESFSRPAMLSFANENFLNRESLPGEDTRA